MNSDSIKGNWAQVKGRIREEWGKLSDDDLERLKGQRDQLIGKIQESYGHNREAIEKRFAEIEKAAAHDKK